MTSMNSKSHQGTGSAAKPAEQSKALKSLASMVTFPMRLAQGIDLTDSKWNGLLGSLLAVGLVAIGVFAMAVPVIEPQTNAVGPVPGPSTVLGTTALVGGASLILGVLAGFLFGIPRVLTGAGDGATAKAAGAATESNTNLEQISDWLTKILVGVGLTQLGDVPDQLWDLAGVLGEGIGGGPISRVFVLSEMLYFAPIGFLWSYLYTRIFLRDEMERADRRLRLEREQMRGVFKEFEENRADADARLMLAVETHLEPSADAVPESMENLEKLMTSASPDALDRVLADARNLRQANWAENKEVMERTIPIFELLLKTERYRNSHRVRGQLGFALKDKRQPDWAEADRLLFEAMEIRDDSGETGWWFYDFNFVVCRINLSVDHQAGSPTPAPEKERIRKIVEMLLGRPSMHAAIANSEIPAWCDLNGVEIPDSVIGEIE